MAIERQPLFHNPAVARLEALADAIVDEFVDARFWDLHDEFVAGRHHREDLAVHFQGARAEPLSRLAGNIALSGKGRDDGRESGVGCGPFTFRGSRRLFASLRHCKSRHIVAPRVAGSAVLDVRRARLALVEQSTHRAATGVGLGYSASSVDISSALRNRTPCSSPSPKCLEDEG